MKDLPDVKTLVDSVADGAIEAAEIVPRVATNVAGVATTFASSIKSNMDNVKSKMPDDPTVLIDAPIRAVGDTVKAGLGMLNAVGSGIQETLGAVQSQIGRIAR